jgi:hypothetical protein
MDAEQRGVKDLRSPAPEAAGTALEVLKRTTDDMLSPHIVAVLVAASPQPTGGQVRA